MKNIIYKYYNTARSTTHILYSTILRNRYIFISIFIIILITLFYQFYNYYNSTTLLIESLNFNNNAFKHEMNNIGIIIDPKNKTLTHKNKSLSFNGHCNDEKYRTLANNKQYTYDMLSKHNISIPLNYKWNIHKPYLDNINILKSMFKPPYVIKPTNGIQGHDIYTDIYTNHEIIKSVKYILKNPIYKGIIVEQQLIGNSYRVLIVSNIIVDVIKIELPYVIGDGKSSIQDLINQRNSYRKKHNLNTTTQFNLTYINQQLNPNISNSLPMPPPMPPPMPLPTPMSSIIPLHKKIIISRIANSHNGANLHRIPINTIPIIHQQYFLLVHKLSGLRISGIDYISVDITNSKYSTKYSTKYPTKYPIYVLDINPGPGLSTHIDASDTVQKTTFLKKLSNSFLMLF